MPGVAPSLSPLSLPRPPNGIEIASGCTLELDASTLELGPGVLAGGAPFRMIRLSDHGAALVANWLRGIPLGDELAARRVATQLVHGGFLNPSWNLEELSGEDVTVVIPHRNQREQLAGLLESLGELPVVVVDDASDDEEGVVEVCQRFGAKLIHRTERGGPSSARNDGMSAVTTTYVAFLDADCTVGDGWLEPLVAQMRDPRVGVVAPRIVGPRGTTRRGQFEQEASPLDVGQAPGLVRPQSPRSFVPGAALLVRRSLGASLFDRVLDLGEDVDAIWRLCDAGWLVRYEPRSTVIHEMRSGLAEWINQRFRYGTSAAILAERHGDAVAPLQGTPAALGAWSLIGLGHPVAGLGLGALGLEQLRRRLVPFGDEATSMAATLFARYAITSGPHLARQVVRTYGPLLVLGAMASRSLRRCALGAFLLSALDRWRRTSGQANVTSFVAYSTLDDLAYGMGVLWGALKHRSGRALMPRLVRSRRTGSPR
jgi:mycofactocin glycosyltransferase